MAYFQDISMPPDLDLGASYAVRVAAYDASTGAAVTGVTVTEFSIEVTNLTGGDLTIAGFRLVPGPGA